MKHRAHLLTRPPAALPLAMAVWLAASLLPGTRLWAAEITWKAAVATGDSDVSHRGTRVEAGNFGNAATTSPTVNSVPFTAIDFTAGESPSHLAGLTYNTGENGKLPGNGINELFDTIAYRSGIDPQRASLVGLRPDTDYEVQFFYYHDSVNRSVSIDDGTGHAVTLSETGAPLFVTGTFTADDTVQSLVFDANTGSQFLNAYQLRELAPGYVGSVAEVSCVPGRGFYSEPVEVLITTPTPGAVLRYTLDGSEPTRTDQGHDYPEGTGLILSRTTTLRVAAFKEGYRSSPVVTHTFLFATDIVQQPAQPTGFPTTWTGWDYGMEEDPLDLALIAGDAALETDQAKEAVVTALESLPALSLVMPMEDWFSPVSGIYHNSLAEGMAWERRCSAELIFPGSNPKPGFQIDCGVRMQGFTSRQPTANPKHSLRLAFRSRYGAAKLDYPLFGEEPPMKFDTLVLRSNSQDAWVYNSAGNRLGQFVRDEWNRRVQRKLGQPSPRGTWVHLFLNGLYWGVYNPTERPDAAFGASRFGGNKDDYDAIKNHEEIVDGTDAAHRRLLGLIQQDPDDFSAGYCDLSSAEAYDAVATLLELENLVDYIIHNTYSAAEDWPGNYYMIYDRTGLHGGWRFLDWDNEHGLKGAVTEDRTAPHWRDRDSPTKFHQALVANADYRLLFADRLHRAFSEGGSLWVDPDHPHWDVEHPERNQPAALWMDLTAGIQTALIAESARWGDYRQSPPYTVHRDFSAVREDLLQDWFPRRSAIVLEQFRAAGLYPNVTAPTYSHSGGPVPVGLTLNLTAPSGGTILFTMDGSDPRLPHIGEIAPGSRVYDTPLELTESVHIRARVREQDTWSARAEAVFIVGIPASAKNLVVAEILYHPHTTNVVEFLEVMNTSPQDTIDLTGVRFTEGIGFTFPIGTRLGPGQRSVVVQDIPAFEAAYGPGRSVAGQFTGQLDNSGERITLRAYNGEVICRFSYDDVLPWPESPDRSDRSLVLIAPEYHPSLENPAAWRPSVAVGGTPGGTDEERFVGDPAADEDGDGWSALIEYALGSSDLSPEPFDQPEAGIAILDDGTNNPTTERTYTFRRRRAADDVVYDLEWSNDLTHWHSDPKQIHLITRTDHGDGTSSLVYRCDLSATRSTPLFLRLTLVLRQPGGPHGPSYTQASLNWLADTF